MGQRKSWKEIKNDVCSISIKAVFSNNGKNPMTAGDKRWKTDGNGTGAIEIITI